MFLNNYELTYTVKPALTTDHLYQATTYLHRPVAGVPAAPHSKLCSETLPKATICLMRTTTTFYTPLVEK